MSSLSRINSSTCSDTEYMQSPSRVAYSTFWSKWPEASHELK